MAVEGRRATDHRSEIVTAAGAATTLLALAAVFALAHDGENVMGWYQYGVLPAAALDRKAFDSTILRHGPLKQAREANRQQSRIAIDAVRCPRCAEGYLAATRFEGHGKRIARFQLPSLPLTSDAMRTLLD